MYDILVVDDSVDSLRILSDCLSAVGRVRTVRDPRQVSDAVRIRLPNLLVLDVNMPEVDGFAVYKAFRRIDGASEVPVIFLSASHEVEKKVQAFDVGAVDYVTKPYDLVEFERRVRLHLEKHRLRELLTQHNRDLQGELAAVRDLGAMVVHDLRSPLQSLTVALMLLRKKMSDSRSLDILGTADSCLRQLSDLVDHLLALTRLEAGLPVERSRVNLGEVLREVAQTSRESHRVKVEEVSATSVLGDRIALLRLFQNLVDNALKFSDAAVEIFVGADNEAKVVVSDSGVGMSPEEAQRVLTAGYRVAATRDSCGLGLRFCRVAAEVHGATLTVESRVGSGSKFSVAF